MIMHLAITAVSDKGRVRARNEDMLLAGDALVRDTRLEQDVRPGKAGYFLAVADGMGGPPAGDVASEFVLREMKARTAELEGGLSSRELERKCSEWLREIHRDLRREGKRHPEKQGMGSTLTGLLFYGGGIYVVHAGDSRLYAYRGGRLRQLSRDHTLREKLQDPNIPSNILTNALGVEGDIAVDFAQIAGEAVPGTRYLLCSDGLSDMLGDREIGGLLGTDDAANSLLNAAITAGGRDNISLLIAVIL
jgi:protein phosphatase